MRVDLDAKYAYVPSEAIRLLAIDDDPILREFACVYLTTPTVSVETCASGEEGLQRLAEERFDFVICDVDMPGLTGFEVLQAIRADQRFKHLPVVILTSNEDMASIDRAFAAGADFFVVKPVNWRLMSHHIRFVHRAVRLQAEAKISQTPDAGTGFEK